MSLPRPVAATACPRCATELAPGLLSCPQCRQLVHADELKRLAAQAEGAQAAADYPTAASRWQDALRLLPPDARQAQVIAAKIEALGAHMLATPGPKAGPQTPAWLKGGGIFVATALLLWKLKFLVVLLLTKGKLLLLGLTKMSTLASMLLAFGVYWTVWGWPFAAGLIVSIYIHEMGHVAWLARYGIKASAPMFIPGLGAIVRMHQYPPAPGIDARVGLAGPLWGLGAAALAWVVYLATDAEIWAAIAQVGAWVNLFNLIPIGPLDGGRGFRALTKGERLIAAAVIGATWYATGEPLLVLLLIAALVQAFGKAADKPDTQVLASYAVLIIALGALSTLDIDPRAAIDP